MSITQFIVENPTESYLIFFYLLITVVQIINTTILKLIKKIFKKKKGNAPQSKSNTDLAGKELMEKPKQEQIVTQKPVRNEPFLSSSAKALIKDEDGYVRLG